MNIKTEIINIISNCLEIDANEINPSMELSEIDGFDSMRNVMIIANIEDFFDIIIPEDDLFDITTIDEWVTEVTKLIG